MNMRRKIIIVTPIALCTLFVVYMLASGKNTSCNDTLEKARREEQDGDAERKRQVPVLLPIQHPPAPALLPIIYNLTKMTIVPPLQKYSSIVRNKFSIIIPTYKRMTLLLKVLNNYCALSSHVDMVVVVWNDLETDIPAALNEYKCNATLVVKKEQVNSLHNRFLPFPELRTEAVLSSDDDLIISHEDLILQFETWQRFKHLLVGFAARRHIEQPPGSGKYTYVKKVSREDPRYSFILTTSAMFHVKYLQLYHARMPQDLRKFVDDNMNCEDILINAIIAEHLNNQSSVKQCPALMVEQKNIVLIEKENGNDGYQGLWHRKKHKQVREECFSLIAKNFNGIPFEYSAIKSTHVFPETGTINFL